MPLFTGLAENVAQNVDFFGQSFDHRGMRKPTYRIDEVPGKRGKSWLLSGYTATGKRVRKRFQTEDLATGEKHRLEMSDLRQENEANLVRTRLHQKDIAEVESLMDRLPDGATLADAVNRYLAEYNRGGIRKAFSDALVDYLTYLERTPTKRGKRAARTILERKNKLLAFARHAKCHKAFIDAITKAQVKAWLEGAGRSANDRRAAIHHFFQWAVDQELCRANPAATVTRIAQSPAPIRTFAPDQSKRILRAAATEEEGRWQAYFAIALFLGLRPESELARVSWEDIDLENKLLYVRSGKKGVEGFTYQRKVPISEPCLSWIKRHLGKDVFVGAGAVKSRLRVLAAAGFTPSPRDGTDTPGKDQWIQDGTRKTCITMRAARGDEEGTILHDVGTSKGMLENHYRDIGPKHHRAAKEFWGLTPAKVLVKERSQKLRVV